jgi:hypothetical protein
LRQILVGGAQQPHIHPGGDIAAQGLHLPLLQDPQQTGLHRRVQVPHFVQKQGAAVGLLKFAQAAAGRPGEGALQVAEELAGGQLPGQQGAVDPIKGLGAPGTQGPEGLGQQFLAGARFAGDQDRQGGGGQPGDLGQPGLEGRMAGEQAVQAGSGGGPEKATGEKEADKDPCRIAPPCAGKSGTW